MPYTQPLRETRPISDLRTKLGEIEEHAHANGEPIVLTRNGKSSLIVMSADAYDARIIDERIAGKLREAEIEAKYQRETCSLEDSRSRIAQIRAAIEGLYA